MREMGQFLLLILLSLPPSAHPQPTPPSHYVISLSPLASSDERAAAAMLADELGNRTCGGLPLPVVSPNATAGRPTIAIGTRALVALQYALKLPALLPSDPSTLGEDGFVARGGGEAQQWMALAGKPGSLRGAGYAVVHALNALGIRFLSWDCTIYPACPKALPALNWTQWPPQFSGRSLDSWPVTHATNAGGSNRRFQTASHYHLPALVGSEGVSRFLPWSLSASHPEWFWPPPAKPGDPPPTFWNVCWSNSSMVRFVIAAVEKELQGILAHQQSSAGGVPFVQISPNDGPAQCQTMQELHINAEEGTDAGSFFRAINAIAAAITPKFPQTKIVSLAYSWTQRPPQPLNTSRVPRLHPAVVPWFAPIDDNFAIPHLVDPSLGNVHQFCGTDQDCPWNRPCETNDVVMPSSSLSRPLSSSFSGQELLVDMLAESCGLLQNSTHEGWACGYLTPPAIMRALRALIAAAEAPGLTEVEAARVARSSLPIKYTTLVKWEELRAWETARGRSWPLTPHKEAMFGQFVASLREVGVTVLGEGVGQWTEAWLRDRIFFGNATGCT